MRLNTIVLSLGAALLLSGGAQAEIQLGKDTISPRRGVICDKTVCATARDGISADATAEFLGASIAERIRKYLKDPYFDAESFTFQDGVNCDITLMLCFVDRYFDDEFHSKVALKHTRAMFGRRKVKEKIAATTPIQMVSDPKAATWQVSDNGDEVILVHGVPETDDQDFYASCQSGSGTAVWSLPYVPEGYGGESTAKAMVFATPFNTATTYPLKPVFDDQFGAYMPTATIDAPGPLLEWIWRGRALSVLIDGKRFDYPLKGSKDPTRTFIKACRDPS